MKNVGSRPVPPRIDYEQKLINRLLIASACISYLHLNFTVHKILITERFTHLSMWKLHKVRNQNRSYIRPTNYLLNIYAVTLSIGWLFDFNGPCRNLGNFFTIPIVKIYIYKNIWKSIHIISKVGFTQFRKKNNRRKQKTKETGYAFVFPEK